ncbi:DUF2293 domain-containing protein [Herbidospora sp. NEAU-GS84]|uniref:DUF2293 domain-containing protein n=1 Tax=Herbidospora solisilvae TaxID=2696284 RepID=A0A7C9J5B9_9ACTN|nr:DUF2293 domain-containing protein [Herbidospora solisilvae]NAS24240.1 DUF2293 domain-containing protein [Herbidospora solisilvae]
MRLGRRVAEAAEIALATRKYVTVVDVLTGLRWVHHRHIESWRQGRAGSLEELAAVDAARMTDAAALLAEWAGDKGLIAGETVYVSGSRDRSALRFTRDGSEEQERNFHRQWISPAMSEARRRRLTETQNRPPDLRVLVPQEPWRCAGCRDTGPYLIMEDASPHCLTCADMDHLVMLPAGNAALSRRAKKESGLSAVVVEYNPRRKRFERRGVLVEEAALARAEELCLEDEELRARRRDRDAERRAHQDVEFQARMAAEILRLFPGCPRADEIAAHAAVRGSGRVGRTSAAKVLDESAITLAVVASVRHKDTAYDELLMKGVPRMTARAQIRDRIDAVLESWRAAPV